jgi:mycofactocin precursor
MQVVEKEREECAVEQRKELDNLEQEAIVTPVLEEITIEELAVDGICGVY